MTIWAPQIKNHETQARRTYNVRIFLRLFTFHAYELAKKVLVREFAAIEGGRFPACPEKTQQSDDFGLSDSIFDYTGVVPLMVLSTFE